MDTESINRAVSEASDFEGTYEDLMQKFDGDAVERAPKPPDTTPVSGRSVSLRIRVKLSALGITPSDSGKFTVKDGDNLFVDTTEEQQVAAFQPTGAVAGGVEIVRCRAFTFVYRL